MRRALVFAHFDPHGVVDDYVLHALACYRQYFELIHFVSTAALNSEQFFRVASLVDRVILRNNIGYDFLSWRAGYEVIANAQIYDDIVFANDSCYGPCSDMEHFWERVQALDADLWGASVNRQYSPHVQSYFMGFGSRLIKSGFLADFWSSVEVIPGKLDLILAYEVGLSLRVKAAGFEIGGVVDYPSMDPGTLDRVVIDNMSITDEIGSEAAISNIIGERFHNPLQLFWSESMRHGLPFVKIELIRDNPLRANLINLYQALRGAKWYDVTLISRHIARIIPRGRFPPDPSNSNGSAR